MPSIFLFRLYTQDEMHGAQYAGTGVDVQLPQNP